MKTKIFIAALAAAALCTSCMKDHGQSSDVYKVTLRLQSTATRAELPAATPGTVVEIIDGYICFVSANDAITDVYTISGNATEGKNIENADLESSTVTLNNVPGTSAKVYMISNPGHVASGLNAAPAVGGNMTAYMTNNMELLDQFFYSAVTSTGNASLVAGSVPDTRTAAIALSTDVARIQIKGITFSGDISGKVAGIFINGYYPTMQLNGTGNSLKSSTIASDYDEVAGSAVFPFDLVDCVYDFVDQSFNTSVATTVAPPMSKVWGYSLFKSPTPQIVIKLTDVVVGGQALATDQFVTINGFKNSATSAAINTLEGGMIYTLNTESLVIRYENMTPEPGIKPISVEVTVTPVVWRETIIVPTM